MRYTVAGRILLRLLSTTVGLEPGPLLDALPAHSRQAFAALARVSAMRWRRLAADLESAAPGDGGPARHDGIRREAPVDDGGTPIPRLDG